MSYENPTVFRWKDPTLPPQAPALQMYFLEEPKVNVEATAETGIQTYDNVLVAYVSPMGNSKSNVAHEIERTLPDGSVVKNQFASAKYAEQIKHYKAGTSSETLGTPLKDLIGMTPATQMNLRARGIHTIEMLTDMPDSAGADLMGFWDLRERAKKHIEMREKQAPTVRLESELAARDATIANLQKQVDDLIASVGDTKKRGPGRPPKEQEAA